jgi:predicted nucleic acid-binding Zn ribbon protein
VTTWKPAKTGDDGPRPIGASLERVGRSLGMPAADTLGAVFGRWSSLVGEQVAAHATPVRLRHGALSITVDDPVWATQIRWLEHDLVARLGEALGEGVVERIEVRVRPG